MGLLEIIDKDLIIDPMTVSGRDEVIRALVARYAEKANIGPAREEEIASAVIARENIGSTAMGKGIAIPHAKVKGLESGVVVIGVSRLPVDFGGEECQVFFLVLASEDNPSEHIQILSSIARLCSSDVFTRMLKGCKTPAEVYQLFFD